MDCNGQSVISQVYQSTLSSDISITDTNNMVDVPIFDTTSAYPPSHIAIDDSDRRMALRSQTAGSNSAYHKMCQNEREIWENSRRSPVDKFVRDLYWRLIKVKRQTDGLETEEEKEAREFAEDCKRSALYLAVMNGNDSTTDLSTSTNSSNPLRRFFSAVSSRRKSPYFSSSSSRKNSKISTPSARQSSTTSSATVSSPPTPSPLATHRISLPLERDPNYRRYNRYSTSSAKPDFQPLNHTEPSNPITEESDPAPISVEIFRVVTNPAAPSQKPLRLESPRRDSANGRRASSARQRLLSVSENQPLIVRTYRKTSTADGMENIELVKEIDEEGKRRVRVEWGVGVDEVIPSESEVDKRKEWIMAKKRKVEDSGKRVIGKIRSLGFSKDRDYGKYDSVCWEGSIF